MHKVIGFLILIRVSNLLFMGITQYSIRLFVIEPQLDSFGIEPSLNAFEFFLLVLSTVLIAAAGYVINDYFDVNMDHLNRPGKIVVDRVIHRRSALKLHMVCNIVAIVIATYLGWKAGIYKLGFIYFISAGLLWFYTTSFKRMFLVGNFVVAFLTGLVVLIVPLYETTIYNKGYSFLMESGRIIMIISIGYSLFAFLASLIREMVKDMEDVHGDEAFNYNTVPLILGLEYAKVITTAVILIMMGLLGFVQYKYWIGGDNFPATYLMLLVQLPMLSVIYFLIRADEKEDFAKTGYIIKAVMLAGILSIPVFYYVQW